MRAKSIFTAALLGTVLALVLAASSQGDVGVEKVSRHAAKPGAQVKLTLACGFCFPPCKGAPGHRDGPCMLDTKKEPPAAFAISLVPLADVPQPYGCGPNALCAPEAKTPPGRAPYTYLGEALAEGRRGGGAPKYGLDFKVPDLRPGVYSYVIYCDVCNRGKGGSLIAYPRSRVWRLRVR